MIRTINDAYLDLRAEFRRKGIAGYQVEARELVSFALGLDYDAFLEKRTSISRSYHYIWLSSADLAGDASADAAIFHPGMGRSLLC